MHLPGRGGRRRHRERRRHRGRLIVPWCDHCDQRLEEEELSEDGSCPDCGATPLAHRKAPWYFKFMLVASVIYLGYRAYQGVTWVVHHI